MKFAALFLFFAFTFGCALPSLAQSDSLKVEKVRKPLKVRGYVAAVYESAPVAGERTNSFGVQAGLLLKNHFQLGFYGLNFSSDQYRKPLIFPNTFQMNYKHAGALIGYRTDLEQNFQFNLESKIGFGEVKWDQVETGRHFLADKFQMIQLQGGIDYLLTKFIAINGFVGYRWMQNLEITGLTNEDFEGMYFGVALKAGIFK